jgi:hypothetical protein
MNVNKKTLYRGIIFFITLGVLFLIQNKGIFTINAEYTSNHVEGLPNATEGEVVELKNGDTYN